MVGLFIVSSLKSWSFVTKLDCVYLPANFWIDCPYKCETWNDMFIIHNAILNKLSPTERVETIDGYIKETPCYIACPKLFANNERILFMQ